MKHLIAIMLLSLAACGGAINLQDGSWSSCTYNKDGRVMKAPLQVGPVPMEWAEPDGTTVKCEPIPRGPEV